MSDGNQFETSGGITEEEMLGRIKDMLEIAGKIPHERILDSKKSQILYAIQEKLREILAAEFIDADIRLQPDLLGGFSCSVIVEAGSFAVGKKHMPGFLSILQNCGKFSVDMLDNGKMELFFTVSDAFMLAMGD